MVSMSVRANWAIRTITQLELGGMRSLMHSIVSVSEEMCTVWRIYCQDVDEVLPDQEEEKSSAELCGR